MSAKLAVLNTVNQVILTAHDGVMQHHFGLDPLTAVEIGTEMAQRGALLLRRRSPRRPDPVEHHTEGVAVEAGDASS